MKERPILFSAPMVRALLAGTKTQTRRAVKSFKHYVEACGEEMDCIKDKDGLPSRLDIAPDNWECSPYGVPGDRLWVRETFCAKSFFEPAEVRYRADGVEPFLIGPPVGNIPMPWKPSIFMPRWASRITLEVVSVRVERLQDISEADAVAEGCTDPDKRTIAPRTICHASARTEYMALWEKINGGGSWAANPWVWVVEFKKCVPTSKGAATP